MYEASRRRVISSKPFEEKDSGFIPKFVNMSHDAYQNRGHSFFGYEGRHGFVPTLDRKQKYLLSSLRANEIVEDIG